MDKQIHANLLTPELQEADEVGEQKNLVEHQLNLFPVYGAHTRLENNKNPILQRTGTSTNPGSSERLSLSSNRQCPFLDKWLATTNKRLSNRLASNRRWSLTQSSTGTSGKNYFSKPDNTIIVASTRATDDLDITEVISAGKKQQKYQQVYYNKATDIITGSIVSIMGSRLSSIFSLSDGNEGSSIGNARLSSKCPGTNTSQGSSSVVMKSNGNTNMKIGVHGGVRIDLLQHLSQGQNNLNNRCVDFASQDNVEGATAPAKINIALDVNEHDNNDNDTIAKVNVVDVAATYCDDDDDIFFDDIFITQQHAAFCRCSLCVTNAGAQNYNKRNNSNNNKQFSTLGRSFRIQQHKSTDLVDSRLTNYDDIQDGLVSSHNKRKRDSKHYTESEFDTSSDEDDDTDFYSVESTSDNTNNKYNMHEEVDDNIENDDDTVDSRSLEENIDNNSPRADEVDCYISSAAQDDNALKLSDEVINPTKSTIDSLIVNHTPEEVGTVSNDHSSCSDSGGSEVKGSDACAEDQNMIISNDADHPPGLEFNLTSSDASDSNVETDILVNNDDLTDEVVDNIENETGAKESPASPEKAAEQHIPIPQDVVTTLDAKGANTMPPTPLFTLEEFEDLWGTIEHKWGCTLEKIEESSFFREGNGKLSAEESTTQVKAQYGRIKCRTLKRLFDEVYNILPHDVFVDIGHGVGIANFQAAYTVGCESRGIELVFNRFYASRFFEQNLENVVKDYRQLGRSNPPVGSVKLRQGKLEDEQHREFLVAPPASYHNTSGSAKGTTKAFVNNFGDVYGERSAKNRSTVYLDNYVAGLFALMVPGSIMVTMHPLSLPPPRREVNENRRRQNLSTGELNASFYDFERISLGEARGQVSWAGGSCTNELFVWKYTRLEQDTDVPVFLCSDPNCENATNNIPNSALRTVDNGIIVDASCGHDRCRKIQRNLRRQFVYYGHQ